MTFLGRRKAARLQAAHRFRVGRRAADEDITLLGEQLAELHVETLASPLDDDMRADYQRALDAYDHAKLALARATAARTGTGLTPWYAAGELDAPRSRRRQALRDASGHGELEVGLAEMRSMMQRRD